MALNSTSTIRILDLLCEGPIEGIVGARQGVYLKETPLNTGDTENFAKANVSYDIQLGNREQDQLSQGKDGVSNIVNVATEVGSNYSETLNENNEVTERDYGAGQLIRQITDPEVDRISLLFTIPRLFSTAQEGLARNQLFDATVKFEVYVQSADSKNYQKKYTKTINGISTSSYQYETPLIELTGSAPWNVKVVKLDLGESSFEVTFNDFEDTATNTPLSNGRGNQLLWTSLIEHQSIRTAYPYSAVAGLNVSTEEFDGLPTRAYLIKGKKVKIPHNATVRADGSLTFQGAFNGSLKAGEHWTTCPVCCFYDMLTNPRYGAGDFVTSANVSWTDLYPLAQYANELIDGEPRFACNTVIGNQSQAFNVLQDLASVFRGMVYWHANTIQATADHGRLGQDYTALSPVHLYTNSNVVEGAFNYSGTSLKTRSTSIRVRYNDPDNFYKSNLVVVENADLISKYGYQVKEIAGIGCTSRNQAARMGRWLLAAEELDGNVISFATGLQGAVVLPGQIFAVADEMRQGVRLAGRISSATTTVITADQTISLPAGTGHELTCLLSDGTVETKTISSVSGADITVSSAFSSAPQTQALWSISSSAVTEQKFRCLSVADNGDGTYAITGVEHNDSIYQVADEAGTLRFDDVTTFDEAPPVPTGLKLTFRQVQDGAKFSFIAVVGWNRGGGGQAISFDIRYKIGNGNWRTDSTTNTQYDVQNLKSNTGFQFQVRAVGVAPENKKSKWVSATGTVPQPSTEQDATGDSEGTVTELPPDIDNVTIQASGSDQISLRWDFPNLGFNLVNHTVIIRHSSKTDGTGTWSNSTKLREVSATTDYVTLPLIEGEYLVKAYNTITKLYSANANSAVIDLPNSIPRLNIQVRREDTDAPPFQGQANDVFYSEEYDGLVLDGNLTLDDIAEDIDDLDSFDFVGTRQLAGTYVFASVLDLGGKFSVVFNRTLTTRGLYPNDSIDQRTALIDRWSDFDGDLPDATSADLYFRTSDQATVNEQMLLEDGDFLLLEDGNKFEMESDINFGPWQPMESGRYTGRQFQFKCDLSSEATDQTPIVDELGYVMQLESRTESSATIASGAAAKAVTFTNAFYQTPNVGITAFDLDSGDYYRVTSTSRTGFTITFFDSSNTAVDRNFQYQAVGFGSEES